MDPMTIAFAVLGMVFLAALLMKSACLESAFMALPRFSA